MLTYFTLFAVKCSSKYRELKPWWDVLNFREMLQPFFMPAQIKVVVDGLPLNKVYGTSCVLNVVCLTYEVDLRKEATINAV